MDDTRHDPPSTPNVASSSDPDVFLSYSRKDEELATALYRKLSQTGLRVWMDTGSIPPGVEFARSIRNAIDRCQAFLFLMTENSLKSQYCQMELQQAVERNKRLLPVAYTGLPPESVPSELRSLELIRVSLESIDQAVKKIQQAYRYDESHVETHTLLLRKALDWRVPPRDSSKLLRGRELKKALGWLDEASAGDPLPNEFHQEFLESSRKARTARRLTGGGALILLTIASIVVWQVAVYLDRNAKVARCNRLVAESHALLAAEQVEEARRGFDDAAAFCAGLGLSELPARVGIWSAQQRYPKPVLEIAAHEKMIEEVAFLPDGRRLVSASRDGRVVVWDSESGDRVRILLEDPESRWIRSFTLTSDGKELVVGVAGGDVLLLDPAGTEPPRSLVPGPTTIFSAVAHPIKPHVFLGHANGSVSLIHKGDGREVRAWSAHKMEVNTMDISGDGRWLLTGSRDKTIRLWDLVEERGVRAWGESTINLSHVASVRFLPGRDNLRFLSGEADGIVRVWDASNGKQIRQYRADELVSAVAMSPDFEIVFAGSLKRDAAIFDYVSGIQLRFLDVPEGVRSAAFSQDGNLIAIGSKDGRLVIWQTYSPSRLTMPSAPASTVAVDQAGRRVVRRTRDGDIELRDLDLDRVSSLAIEGDVLSASFASDGQSIVVGTSDGRLGRADPATGFIDWTDTFDGPVSQIVIGASAIIGTKVGTSRVCFGAHENISCHLDPKNGQITGMGISDDGEWLAVGYDTGEVFLWSVSIGQLRNPLIGHAATVNSLSFSTDGDLLITGGSDGTVRSWATHSGEALDTYRGFEGEVRGVALTEDGRSLLAVTDRGQLTLRDLESHRIVWLTRDVMYAGFRDAISVVRTAAGGKMAVLVRGDQSPIRVLRFGKRRQWKQIK